MRRWLLLGLTVLLLVLTGCQGNWLATEGYVDRRIEDVDAKYAGAWEDAERALMTAQAQGKDAGDAAVTGLKAGAVRSRDSLPTPESDMEWLVSLLETLGMPVRCVQARSPNPKLTTDHDLAVIRALAEATT